jgi:transcriptional regulator with XRE-family HTH domain
MSFNPAKIREARKELGWTQFDLSWRSRLPEPYIGRWERGQNKPNMEALEVLARTLDKPLEYFFVKDGE